MLRIIWDYLFVRKTWTIIDTVPVYTSGCSKPVYVDYILQDQFGNIKKKRT